MALSVTAILGAAGLAIDTVRAYFTRAALSAAIDGAVMAAARVPEPQMEQVADAVFRANFPDGLMTTRSRSHQKLRYDAVTGRVSMEGAASLDTFFMRALGQNELNVTATATAERPQSASPQQVAFILTDPTAISTNAPAIHQLCGPNAKLCLNEDVAAPGVRRPLFERPKPLAAVTMRLETGQAGDEGFFRFFNPETQASLADGSRFTAADFISAAGVAANPAHLDRVADIAPLRAPELTALQGRTVCAVAFRDQIVTNPEDHSAALGGETLGITAFRVVSVEESYAGATRLPAIDVDVFPAAAAQSACSQAAQPPQTGSRVPLLVR